MHPIRLDPVLTSAYLCLKCFPTDSLYRSIRFAQLAWGVSLVYASPQGVPTCRPWPILPAQSEEPGMNVYECNMRKRIT